VVAAAGGDSDVFFCGGPQKNMVADHAIFLQKNCGRLIARS
jgi:hypothetical protein